MGQSAVRCAPTGPHLPAALEPMTGAGTLLAGRGASGHGRGDPWNER
jgi:hypothetical protein